MKVDKFSKSKLDYPFCNYTKDILNEIIKANIDDRAATTNFILWEDCIEDYYKSISSIYDDLCYTYSEDILLILVIIKVVFGEMYSYKTNLLDDFELPFYFSYSPPNILPRIVNQSSLFIYQLYHDDSLADTYIDKFENRITQRISPDFTIKINNKEKILESLDNMGINLKFIYNDFDNIAKYIKNKFFNL